MQTSLFTPPLVREVFEQKPTINGLVLIEDFLSKKEEKELVDFIDSMPWLTDLKRRVQHYGFRYDYKLRKTNDNLYLGPLPDLFARLTKRLQDELIATENFDQAIVNEYRPGEGIAQHIDCKPCFGKSIVSISLLSGVNMKFQEKLTGFSFEKNLPPRSLALLEGDARYNWSHGIPNRRTDVVNGKPCSRSRRISLTFRKVIY